MGNFRDRSAEVIFSERPDVSKPVFKGDGEDGLRVPLAVGFEFFEKIKKAEIELRRSDPTGNGEGWLGWAPSEYAPRSGFETLRESVDPVRFDCHPNGCRVSSPSSRLFLARLQNLYQINAVGRTPGTFEDVPVPAQDQARAVEAVGETPGHNSYNTVVPIVLMSDQPAISRSYLGDKDGFSFSATALLDLLALLIQLIEGIRKFQGLLF